jgi:protein involved in polysaccharide export with SLBB domain
VTIYGEESGVYEINPAGSVRIPLVGPIRAAGRTLAELEREITSAYRRGNFLQDPNVTVTVVEFQPYYMIGEAVSPGQFPYRSGLNVLTAISTAGVARHLDLTAEARMFHDLRLAAVGARYTRRP